MADNNSLNQDLFGNVIPDVKPKTVDVGSTPNELDSDDFYFTTTKANAPKYTLVKEGQQHPVGKHGQLKLFHEHQWPKGYTPQRLAEVRANAPAFATIDLDPDGPLDDLLSHEPKMEHEYIDHLARSTVPVEHLKAINDEGIVALYGKYPESKGTGSFVPNERALYIQSNSEVAPERRLHRSIFGTRKQEESGVLIHELGHAHDFSTNPAGFALSFSRSQYRGHPSNPSREGFAEGYRKRHNRATRAMKRKENSERTSGYVTEGWSHIPARNTFQRTRRAVFEGTFARPQVMLDDDDDDI